MAVERLSFESASPHTLFACAQAHRYELAASVFRGQAVVDLGSSFGNGSRVLSSLCHPVLGVSEDAAETDLASATVGRTAGVDFVNDDLMVFLRRGMPSGFDALVAYELLDRLSNAETAVHELRRHAEAGLPVLTSITTGDSDAPIRIARVKEWFDGAPNVRFLHQYEAEGSVIESGGQATGGSDVTVHHRGEPDYATSLIVAMNIDPEVLAAGNTAVLPLRLEPLQRRYMRSLELANRELRQANARLGREHLGVADSAAASLLRRAQTSDSSEAIPAEGTRAKAELDAWVASLELEIERHRELVRDMEETRAWKLLSRYRGVKSQLSRILPGR